MSDQNQEQVQANSEIDNENETPTIDVAAFTKRRPYVYARSIFLSAFIFFIVYYLSFAIKTEGFSLEGVSRLGQRQQTLFLYSVGWVVAIKLLVFLGRKSYRNLGVYATCAI